MKVEGQQPLGGTLILENYPTTSSDLEEGQQQTEELPEQGDERQLTEEQLREAQYRQALLEQQQERLLEEPLSDEVMPQGEDEQLTEEQQERSPDSNSEELSDVAMFSSADIEDEVAVTMTHDDVSMVNKTRDVVTSQCEERAANVVWRSCAKHDIN